MNRYVLVGITCDNYLEIIDTNPLVTLSTDLNEYQILLRKIIKQNDKYVYGYILNNNEIVYTFNQNILDVSWCGL